MFSNLSLLTKKCTEPFAKSVRTTYGCARIGNRDVVGHGINGMANYKDDSHFPFPAVRFKENTRDICALREKEKGDWRLLCCEEKKALYRASFCQTFSEFQHPTGQWKFCVGWALFATSFTFWMVMFCHYYEEKKALYRASFCQTFAEFQAPTGQWKFCVGWALFATSFTFWMIMFSRKYVWDPLPSSFSKESQKAQLRRMLELRVNPIDGLSSHWDYDNDRWKK